MAPLFADPVNTMRLLCPAPAAAADCAEHVALLKQLLLAGTVNEPRTIVANAANGEEATTQLRERHLLGSAIDQLPAVSHSKCLSVALLQSEHAAFVRSTMGGGEALTTPSYKEALIKADSP